MAKREKWLLLCCLPLIVCLLMALWSIMPSSNDDNPITADNGVWDMRGVDFAHETAKIAGQVYYIPNQLLTPEQLALREDELVFGDVKHNADYATSIIRVLLPPGEYMLAGYSVDFSNTIYINGELALQIGVPGDSAQTTVPETKYYSIPVRPDENGVLEIVQQAANFVHRETGNHASLHIGTAENIQQRITRTALPVAIIMGCYLVLFLVHLLLFFMLRSYPQNLYFSLFCLTWFFRTGVTGMHLLQTIIPGISWELALRIEYAAMPITGILLVLLMYRVFPGALPKWFVWLTGICCGVFLLIDIFAPTLFMSYTIVPREIVFGVLALFVVVRTIWKRRRGDLEQRIILAGLAFFLIAFVWDALYYNNIVFISFLRFPILGTAMTVFILFCMVAMFLGTMRAVAKAQEREQKLALENATLLRVNELKSELTATISHEMRTPLAVMSVYAQLIVEAARENKIDEQAVSGLESISAEAKRLAEMATDLLGVSRMQESNKEKTAIDIGAILQQTARLCTPMVEKQNNHLDLAIADKLPTIIGNAGELTQLTWNLLANAAAHTKNGVIGLSAQTIEQMIELTFSDNGSGIDPAALPHIFERQPASTSSSHGIGLSICRDIVEDHGGSISLQSKLCEGTTITVLLPIAKGGQADE